MRSATRFALTGLAMGVLPPSAVLGLQYVSPQCLARFMHMRWGEEILLSIWPSSLLLLGAQEGDGALVPVASVLINGALYALIFFLLGLLWKRFNQKP